MAKKRKLPNKTQKMPMAKDMAKGVKHMPGMEMKNMPKMPKMMGK